MHTHAPLTLPPAAAVVVPQVLELLSSELPALLVDLRGEEEREEEGVALLKLGARLKVTTFTPSVRGAGWDAVGGRGRGAGAVCDTRGNCWGCGGRSGHNADMHAAWQRGYIE